MTFQKTVESYRQGARTMPRERYASPEIFAQEKEKLFARQWLCVGRSSTFLKPGDFQLRSVADESLIMVRDRGGELHAFFNVCRHRGTRLCEEHTGRFSETIQCPYHAWTYALDGRLIGAPSTADIENFDKADWPLHPVGVATWEGYLFLNLSAHPEPFEQAFEPLLGRFSRFNMPNLKVHRTIEYDVHCNWKLLFQNYSEC